VLNKRVLHCCIWFFCSKHIWVSVREVSCGNPRWGWEEFPHLLLLVCRSW